MSYSQGHPVRPVGGRLALDFVNTADWTANDHVAHEKLKSPDDLDVWLRTLGIDACCAGTLEELKGLRSDLRTALRESKASGSLNAVQELEFGTEEGPQPLLEGLLAASAISILADPRERGRLKMCPGDNCGWLFIDETKNSRRTWCSMESCGNRAKAARHYQRNRKAAAASNRSVEE
ncbi:CGNR zinc finger domain-containing protein [Roseibium sp.]|uniref:CGNR zinc finger domain-containing protein n=1 Tax=Roseibium sp. TaxID=1936156 RepID=UPI003B502004